MSGESARAGLSGTGTLIFLSSSAGFGASVFSFRRLSPPFQISFVPNVALLSLSAKSALVLASSFPAIQGPGLISLSLTIAGFSPGLRPQPGLLVPERASFQPPQASSSFCQGDAFAEIDTRGLLLWLESVAGGGAAGRFIVGTSSVAQGDPHGSSMLNSLA